MKVIDRYITRELVIPIIYASISLITLVLIADVFDNLTEFLRNKTPLTIIGRYYLSLIPYAFVQTISWATWVGTLFLLVNFGMHNELMAMKVAGLKIFSIIRPILFLGFLIGILTFIVSDRLLPFTYRIAGELNDIYINRSASGEEGKVIRNVTFHSGNNHIYYFRTLSLKENTAEDVIILWLDEKTHKTRQKMSAARASWKNDIWEFEQITEHQMDTRGHILGEPRSYPQKTYADVDATPEDLANATRESILLTYKEMKSAMEKLKETGVSVKSELVDLNYRLASPWQSMVMMLIAIPLLAPTRSRKGIASAVLICVGLIFGYHVFSSISVALGSSGVLSPFIAAWAGNIIFASLALINLDRANF